MKVLNEIRGRHKFQLVGYVVMPEHVHILISEPKIGDPSKTIQVLKQRVCADLHKKTAMSDVGETLWQRRFYDFSVYSAAKRREKIEYMHLNPVARGLVEDPIEWVWSSYSSYSRKGSPLVEIDFVD